MGSAGDDNYEREQTRQETLDVFERNIVHNTEELRKLRKHVVRYNYLMNMLAKLNYKVEEDGDNLRIWKEI